jgi:hypothetical protein
MDEARARMSWDICLIQPSPRSGDRLMLNDVLPADGESRGSALVNRKPGYACDQTVESYRSALKNPFPFRQANRCIEPGAIALGKKSARAWRRPDGRQDALQD